MHNYKSRFNANINISSRAQRPTAQAIAMPVAQSPVAALWSGLMALLASLAIKLKH